MDSNILFRSTNVTHARNSVRKRHRKAPVTIWHFCYITDSQNKQRESERETVSTQIFETRHSSNFLPSKQHTNFMRGITAIESETTRNVSLWNTLRFLNATKLRGQIYRHQEKTLPVGLIHDLRDYIDSVLLTWNTKSKISSRFWVPGHWMSTKRILSKQDLVKCAMKYCSLVLFTGCYVLIR